MGENSLIRIWKVIYPILIYYVVSNVVMYLAILALGITQETYGGYYTMLQTLATIVALPVLYQYYQSDRRLCMVFHQRLSNALEEVARKKRILNGVLTFACGALTGLALNNIIGAAGLAQLSQGYQNVTAQFYSGGIFFEILGLGILFPLVEELLYRGLVYGRLSDWIGIPGAALGSALIFGALHMNLVQLIYASLIGLLLVYFLEQTHHLYGAVLGHIGANLLTVFRVETKALDWMNSSSVVFGITTAVLLLLAGALMWFLRWINRVN